MTRTTNADLQATLPVLARALGVPAEQLDIESDGNGRYSLRFQSPTTEGRLIRYRTKRELYSAIQEWIDAVNFTRQLIEGARP